MPKKFSLVYDATDLNENTLVELSKVESPEKTVIILPAYDLEKMQALRRMGFNYFLCFPLVSSQLFYSIRQSSFTKFGTSEETLKLLNQRKLKVLIVDDSVTSRIVLRDFLEAMGHQVVEGSDGHELVKFIEAGQKFDIVFCDQTMPHMDGITALTKMREFEEKEGCATPVVLITAYDEIDEELKEHSFNSVLKKPVNTSEVERAINEFVYKESKIESVAPVVKAETKIIDLEDLRSRCNGKTKTMVRVLESFIATTRIELVNLKNEDTVKNPELLKRKLHTIKGLLREAGAIEVAESVRLMDEKVQSNTAL